MSEEPQKSPEQQLAESKLVADTIREILAKMADAQVITSKETTKQVGIAALGGGAVLGVAYAAVQARQWELAQQIALPVLAFLGGLVAGRSGR